MKPPKGWGGATPPHELNVDAAAQEPSTVKPVNPDHDALVRFIVGAQGLFFDPPDNQSVRAAGDFLLSLVMDVRAGRDIKQRFSKLGIRKKRSNKFEAKTASIFSEEFSIALSVEKKQITEGYAVKRIAGLHNVTERHARTWLEEMRASARLYMGYLALYKRRMRRKSHFFTQRRRMLDIPYTVWEKTWDDLNNNERLGAIAFLKTLQSDEPSKK